STKRSAARTNDARPNIRCAPNKAKATPVQPGGRGGGEALGFADDRHDQILALEQAFGRALGVGERHRLDLGVRRRLTRLVQLLSLLLRAIDGLDRFADSPLQLTQPIAYSYLGLAIA